ncbi:nitrite reductase small subunit NirD [Nocardioides alkalitolerans]|uniref:nitrite reductase small subunit NirD n=1 Tax=Nocardioides alkalitolerans TaxID=281714 RepID=UPI00041EF36C|nr:nitrite reductase small subunit NirD [Nocardioides alkalitolerans]
MSAVRAEGPTTTWLPVCTTDQLSRERGVAALVGGRAVALFRTYDDEWFALDNHCPFAHASVLARGIVGTRGDVPFVASPMLKQPFGLRDGVCLDDPSVRVPTYPVRVVAGVVEVGVGSP